MLRLSKNLNTIYLFYLFPLDSPLFEVWPLYEVKEEMKEFVSFSGVRVLDRQTQDNWK